MGVKSTPMLWQNEGGGFTAGSCDVIGIVKDTSTGRFHATYWEEKPLPGGGPETVARLKSKMHHTTGAETFDEALAHVREMREKIRIDDARVWTAPEKVVERNFETETLASVIVVSRLAT